MKRTAREVRRSIVFLLWSEDGRNDSMAKMSASPNVYIVAGPNGAGKSTFARRFLPEYADCKEFVNADLIAAGLSPFNPESLAIQAGRLMLERIERLADARVDFGFETTLAGRSYILLFRKLKDLGYRIHLCFLWLPRAEIALARVHERVLLGGHSIADDVVRRRFSRGLANLFQVYAPLLDSLLVFENAGRTPNLVALCLGEDRFILQPEIFYRIEQEATRT